MTSRHPRPTPLIRLGALMLVHFMPSAGIVIVMLDVCFVMVLAFEAINGFHDASNAVATVIYTQSIKPVLAVVWSGLTNFIGVLSGLRKALTGNKSSRYSKACYLAHTGFRACADALWRAATNGEKDVCSKCLRKVGRPCGSCVLY